MTNQQEAIKSIKSSIQILKTKGDLEKIKKYEELLKKVITDDFENEDEKLNFYAWL